MAKQSNKDRDRRAVVEQLRREQQTKERRRTIAIVAGCVIIGLVIIAAAAVPLIRQRNEESTPLADLGVDRAAAGCQDVVTEDADGSGQHETEGTTIPYADAPPAFGRHWGNFLTGTEIRNFYTLDERPPVERLVHSLEHGYTIIWYDETIADDDEAMDALEQISDRANDLDAAEDKVMAAPWTSDDGAEFPDGAHVALTHWTGPEDQQGVWEYCEAVSGEVVEDFVADYPASSAPEVGAT